MSDSREPSAASPPTTDGQVQGGPSIWLIVAFLVLIALLAGAGFALFYAAT